jgi:hypothetical protein
LCLSAAAACGSSPASSDAGANTCSADVPKGQACNSLTNVGTPVTPSCAQGAIPSGTGGTIVDGTYTLATQTYYGGSCSTEAVSATLLIAGGCVQVVTGGSITTTASTSYTVAGSNITRTTTCLDLPGVDASAFSPDTPALTFTATPTLFTIFIKNSGTSSPNPDRVEAYAKQ